MVSDSTIGSTMPTVSASSLLDDKDPCGPIKAGRMCIQAAYSTVPPENSTHNATLPSDVMPGACDSVRYVRSAMIGDVAANTRRPVHQQ